MDDQAPPEAAERFDPVELAPPWVWPLVRRTIWRVIWVGLLMSVVVLAVLKARGLVGMLVIALFFSIAMDPAVSALSHRRGWKRGSATGLVFVAVALTMVLLVGFLVPSMINVVAQISGRLPGWLQTLQSQFHFKIGSGTSDQKTAAQLEALVTDWVKGHVSTLFGFASTIVGVVFQVFTIAMFTFYLAAKAPDIRRSVLRRVPPDRQQRLGWAWDTAIKQTGGYFYSRLILMVINGTLFFVAMVSVGMPWTIALVMSLFEGFVAEFIPAVGTYIGAAVPIIVTLGIRGIWPAVVLVIWTVIYQQIENYWLSPKLSSKTMEINGGVAFGAAIAGGSIAGPMGAFMALPIAALITSFVTNFSRQYPLAYRSAYDPPGLHVDGEAPAEEVQDKS